MNITALMYALRSLLREMTTRDVKVLTRPQYIRQAIICAGDTTMDYADDQSIGPDGKVIRYGFTGANSTHQCRDWDAIKDFAERHKSGDMSGILV